MSSTEAGAWDGLPPNPKLDGWHLVCGAPHLWDARNQCWKSHDGVEVFRYSPEKARRLNWTYGGPVRTDADIQIAQREAVEACKDVAERYLGGPASYRMRCEMSALIPPTPDLDAKLKEARREVWDDALAAVSSLAQDGACRAEERSLRDAWNGVVEAAMAQLRAAAEREAG